MTSGRNELTFSIYAPVLRPDDARPLAIVHGMERALAGLRLGWTTSEKGDLLPLPHRDAWISSHGTAGGLPFLCNEDDTHPVTISGWDNPNGLAAEGAPHFEVHAQLPLDTTCAPAAVEVLAAMGEGARAYWGHATPFDATVEISRQTIDPVRKPGAPPRGLPALRLPHLIQAPEVPRRLGWLNYWSAATARALGFPDPSRDADLLSRARSTETGGWVVRLTDAPLDLDDPTHLDMLQRVYARFPEIGGRAPP